MSRRMALILATTISLAIGCGAETEQDGDFEITRDGDDVTAVGVDPDTGLEFEISSQFSDISGQDNVLTVRLTDETTDEAREAVVGSPAALYCDSTEAESRYIPQEWEEDEEDVSARMFGDVDEVSIAESPAICAISLPDPENPDLASEEPYSSVEGADGAE